jgi:hypothetical protein
MPHLAGSQSLHQDAPPLQPLSLCMPHLAGSQSLHQDAPPLQPSVPSEDTPHFDPPWGQPTHHWRQYISSDRHFMNRLSEVRFQHLFIIFTMFTN